MAFSLNRAQIIGNLTRDPEVRMAGASKVASFGVATSRSWLDPAGQKQEKTEFHNIIAWRKLAEICEMYLKKGMKVYIEGRLQTSDWEGKDGVKRYRTEIIAENMIMLSRKDQVGGGVASSNATASVVAGNSESSFPASEERAQRNIKKVEEAADKPAQEAEISIDDLPF
ncbi:single-stranded DNA-binding protein [Candidatus Peregrinibacteria bacterium]|nr:single-stranded DNA-binding protein [Candidatus Peregrinibacteria bacterium]